MESGFHILPQAGRRHLGAVDVARGVHGHAFRAAAAGFVLVLDRVRDELADESGFRAADADAALEARVAPGVGLGVGDIDRIVGIDVDAAGATELGPGRQVLAFLGEDLDTVVVAITNEESTL